MNDQVSGSSQKLIPASGAPVTLEALLDEGHARWDADDLPGARDAFRRAVQLAPESQQAHSALGRVLYELKCWDEAEPELLTAIRLDPDDELALHDLGLLRRLQGELHAAEDFLRRSAELRPRFNACYNLGHILLDLDRFAEAEIEFLKAIALDSSDGDAFDRLGVARMMLQDYAGAVKPFREAIRLNPEFADLRNSYGFTLYKLGRLDEALEQFRAAVEIYPEFALGHYNVGSVLLELGELEAARASLERALELDPTSSKARYELGLVLARQGLRKRAVELWKQVSEDPSDVEAAELARAELNQVQAADHAAG